MASDPRQPEERRWDGDKVELMAGIGVWNLETSVRMMAVGFLVEGNATRRTSRRRTRAVELC